SAELGRFDENGNWQSDNRTVAVTGSPAASAPTAETRTAAAAPAPMARSQEAPMAKADTTARPAGTSGARSTRKSLPRTASSLALFELLSGLSLAGSIGLRQLRKQGGKA